MKKTKIDLATEIEKHNTQLLTKMVIVDMIVIMLTTWFAFFTRNYDEAAYIIAWIITAVSALISSWVLTIAYWKD